MEINLFIELSLEVGIVVYFFFSLRNSLVELLCIIQKVKDQFE
jgi:hypothetical protein